MIPVKYIDPEDLPLYAMDLLSSGEMQEMTQSLQYSGEARRQLSEVYSELALFAQSAELQDPPAVSRQRLLKQIARERKPIPIDRPAPTAVPLAAAPLATPHFTGETSDIPVRRGVAARVLPWVGWAVAAGLAVEAVHLFQQNGQLGHTVALDRQALAHETLRAEAAQTVLETFKDPAAENVVLVTSDTRPLPQGRASYNPKKGSLVFLASNLEALAPYKVYELWLIPADGKSPIPAGTFRPDAQGFASVILPQLPKGVEAKQFGVTVENEGGADAPTSPILLASKPA